MMITNKLEKNTIICALKVQLKRLNKDMKEHNGYRHFKLILALNEEVARIKSLILALEEEI